MTTEEMLEKNVMLAYDEPWPSLSLDSSGDDYAAVQIRVKARDAVNMRRLHCKDNPKCVGITDVRLLEEFITCNYAYVVE